jgi:hypothetical protein
MTRADVAARLTGDKRQALTPLSWWPEVDAGLDDPAVRVVAVWAMRQSGKSQKLMLRAVEDLLLVPNAYVLFISAGSSQAEVVFERKCRRPLLRLARAAGLSAGTIKTTKRGVEHVPLNSALEVVAANEATVPARSASLLIIDEARFISDELFAALAPSVIGGGGKILVASTAGRPSGFFHHLATSGDPEVRVVHVEGNTNPYADPQAIGFLSRLLRRILPSAAARDLDNLFEEDGAEFLPAALIEGAVDDRLGDLPTMAGRAFAFYDLSRKRDLTSRAVVVLAPPRQPEAADHAVLASLRVWNPKDHPTGEVDFAEVRQDLATLPRRFPGLVKVLVDEGAEAGSLLPFARRHPALSLRVEGFVASPESNMRLWGALAARLHAGTLAIPRHERLLGELRSLRAESFALGSKWRVVDSSRRLHRDTSVALAGACYAAGDMLLPICDVPGCTNRATCSGMHFFHLGGSGLWDTGAPVGMSVAEYDELVAQAAESEEAAPEPVEVPAAEPEPEYERLSDLTRWNRAQRERRQSGPEVW